ncbi:MAG: HD-GYP domain-containing protein [Sulfurifustaceae bacterium]
MEGDAPLVHSIINLTAAHGWASLHRPHLLIIDVRTIGFDAIDFMGQIRRDRTCDDIPILAVVDEYRRASRGILIVGGATDLITAPLDPYECQARILNLAELGMQRQRLRDYSHRLEALGEPRADIRARDQERLRPVANVGDFREKAARARGQRLRLFSRAIAEALELPPAQRGLIETAAPLHDIGNIGVADSILRKPGPLTDGERKDMQTHTLIGYRLLKDQQAAHLQCAADIALFHHERYDGSGYPRGVGGEDIPLPARIVAVADVYDALSSPRPHREPWPMAQVHEYLQEQKGKHFDPQCVDALLVKLGKP